MYMEMSNQFLQLVDGEMALERRGMFLHPGMEG
jgi:hypothetical protein